MNQKKISVIAIAAGALLILTDNFILPLILVLTGTAGVVGGSGGIIGGAGLPTLMFLIGEVRRGIMPVLTFVGVFCIAVGIVTLVLCAEYNKKH